MDIEILDFGLSTPACHLHILDLNGKGEAIIVDKPRQAPAWIFAGTVRTPCKFP